MKIDWNQRSFYRCCQPKTRLECRVISRYNSLFRFSLVLPHFFLIERKLMEKASFGAQRVGYQTDNGRNGSHGSTGNQTADKSSARFMRIPGHSTIKIGRIPTILIGWLIRVASLACFSFLRLAGSVKTLLCDGRRANDGGLLGPHPAISVSLIN